MVDGELILVSMSDKKTCVDVIVFKSVKNLLVDEKFFQ